MELFGRQLGPQEIAGLVFSLVALFIWIAALRGERRGHLWFKQWNEARKARRAAEDRAEGRIPPSEDPPRPPSGPWG